MKICNKCGIEKSYKDFYKHKGYKDGLESSCKSCKKVYENENKDRIKNLKKIYYKNNIEKYKKYKLDYNSKNKEKIKNYNKKWREENKDYIKEKSSIYYKEMTDEQREIRNSKRKDWLDNNKEKVRYKKNEYKKNKLKSDIIFSLNHNINTSILSELRKKGYSKKSRTYEILGCSFEEFKLYLESKFEPWMNWENKGLYNGEFNYGWDIDHIIPISSVKTEKDIIKLYHYTNLQPLCSKINRDVKRNL
jgi:hypothetical protein